MDKKIGVLIIFTVILLLFFFNFRSNDTSLNITQQTIEKIVTSPTPAPFYDLTIPYLQQRKYQSKLSDLEKYSQNSNYTSYLTSYDSDGYKINGLLTIPAGNQPAGGWPAIIFIHGYIAPSVYKTTKNYVSYVDYFARNGFVVYKIDLRGHNQSEGEPGGAYYSSDYIIDTLNAKAALTTSDFVNPDKIGLWGHSMAGNVVFRSLVVDQNIPAVVIWAGAVYSYQDFVKYRLNDNSYRPSITGAQRQRRRQQLFDKYGEFDPNNIFWKQVAATNYLDNVNSKIQIHHAVDDNVVNIGYSRDLIKILDKTNINHQLFEYQTGGHNISGDSFNTAMQRSVEFFEKYLK